MGCKENKLNLINENKLFQLVCVRNSHCVTAVPISVVGASNNRETGYFFFCMFYIGIVCFLAHRYTSISTATVCLDLESPFNLQGGRKG